MKYSIAVIGLIGSACVHYADQIDYGMADASIKRVYSSRNCEMLSSSMTLRWNYVEMSKIIRNCNFT